MSVFGKIMERIFHHRTAAAAPGGTAQPSPAPTDDQAGSAAAQPAPQAAAPGTKPAAGVDVEAVLTAMAAKNPQRLDWRHSIVDLMKLLGLDSDLEARRELAQELHYTGDTSDSAAMNMWLHRQVMQKLAENGGQVPAELRR